MGQPGEISTWDIHSQNNALQNGLHANVYESLCTTTARPLMSSPCWQHPGRKSAPRKSVSTCVQGVKFHDGSAFTADDAVYSIQRAMARHPISRPTCRASTRWSRSMSRPWMCCSSRPTRAAADDRTAHDEQGLGREEQVGRAQDMKAADENFAHRNAMGTGPLHARIVAARPAHGIQAQSELVGQDGRQRDGDRLHPIKSLRRASQPCCRVKWTWCWTHAPGPWAARASPDLKVVDGVENRTIFLGMDQFRDELPGSNIREEPAQGSAGAQGPVPGDRCQHHFTQHHAGPGQAHGCAGCAAGGWLDEAVAKRFPYDVDAAKKLLADAGYADGFEVDFACPNNRYINDEAICQAVTAMWARALA